MGIIDKPTASQFNEITLKSIDQSVVNWFQTDFPVHINGPKIPVMYATAERWAKAQKEKGFRDETGRLILPLISIRRSIPAHRKERYAPEADETNLTITKKIATSPISNNDRQAALQGNRRPDGTFLKTADNTVYEVFKIPYPSFVNLDYEIVIWTSFMTHQNLEQENIMRNFAGGRQYFQVDDYSFFGTLDNITDQSNLEDFSDKERIIKYAFKLTIQAYLIDKTNIKSFRTSANAKIRISETSYPAKEIFH